MGKPKPHVCKRSKASRSQKLRYKKQSEDTVNDTSEDTVNDTSKSECEMNISFISDIEYESISSHKLIIEKEPVTTTNMEPAIEGNRIVDLEYVINKILKFQYDHAKVCSYGKLHIAEEIRRGLGLQSKIVLRCNFCNEVFHFITEDPNKNEKSKINTGVVWGTLASGSTFGHTEQLLASMDIPPIPYNTFKKIENELGTEWHDMLWTEMELAGKEELKIAKDKGHIDKDGFPYITVYLDGAWSKRSYGHNYDASSGVGVIIGKQTRKILFVAVRNKYCSICARAVNRKIQVEPHICYRNWSGSSSAMEADIMVEGFNFSESLHGLRYKTFIADGDSSVFARLRERVSYGKDIIKIECTNHAIKNYGKALFAVKKDTRINVKARKILTGNKIALLQKHAQSCISHNENGDINHLKTDLLNGPNHVFNCHKNCKDYYCKLLSNADSTEIDAARSSGLLQYINSALDKLVMKSDRLIFNETNNAAECFMAIVARFNSGKRLNLIQRGSFNTRAYISALQYNKGPNWQYNAWKKYTKKSPAKVFKRLIEQTDKKNIRLVKKNLFSKKKQKYIKSHKLEYGAQAMDIITTTAFQSEYKRKLEELNITNEERLSIAQRTVGQFDNPEYLYYKQNRLTASNFGAIIKRKEYTPCNSLVKQILKVPHGEGTEAMKFGKRHEETAINIFEKQYNIKVKKSGLFIDEHLCYLGASPDGIIDGTTIIEVKCLYSLAKEGVSIEEAVDNLKFRNKICLERKNGMIKLKQNHNYFYQVQGQLNICQMQKCFFIVYTSEDKYMHVEEIDKDTNIWDNLMVPKLKKFYLECVLPEIVNCNRLKGLPCEDSEEIKKAIAARKNITKTV